jgi:branched-subunit amino acid transport protein
MTPLCLANVLINQLMAMREFRHFGLLVSIAAVYAFYLAIWTPSTLVGVIQTIGFFSFILLLCSGLAIRLRRGGKAEGMKINGIPED